MKMVKSLLLGSAAGLVAIAGAQAADLPVKAKPVQYVKICSLYGAGFFYIPGTDTCLKVGGWIRYEQGYGYNASFTTNWDNNNLNNRATVDDTWRVKGVVSFDAREQTEYGTLRSYATLGIANSNIGDNAGTANYVNRWFIQFAGWTIGHASSFYDFYNTGANQYGGFGAMSDSTDGGWDVFGYTAQFGNGFSASLAAEVQRRTQIINAGAAVTNFTGTALASGTAGMGLPQPVLGINYEGHDYPDVVGNMRIDNAWGSAQIMGAIHGVSSLYLGTSEGTGHPGDQVGGAIGFGLKLLTPWMSKGDYVEMEASWAKGASRYIGHGLSGGGGTAANFTKFNGMNVGIGQMSDAVIGGTVAAGTGAMDLTRMWGVAAAATHFWMPTLKTSLWVNYIKSDFGALGNAMLCNAITGGGAVGSGFGNAAVAAAGCNFDWSSYSVGLRTEWQTTKNLAIGLEVLYAKLLSMSTPTGTITLATADGTKPAGVYNLTDPDQWQARLRITRNFYP